jgi:Icc-related predicted phosphoesterase
MAARIAFIGDVHSNIDNVYSFVKKHKVDAIVQGGDFGLYRSEEAACSKEVRHNFWNVKKIIQDLTAQNLKRFDIPIYFIMGNHEDFNNLTHWYLDSLNIHYLPQARVHTICDVRIGVLGGIWSPIKFHWPEKKLVDRNKRFYTSLQIKELSIRATTDDTSIDVLVTHQAASDLIFSKKTNHDEGSKHLRQLVEVLKPKHYVFAHHHKKYEGSINTTKVHGVGNFSKNNQSYVILDI